MSEDEENKIATAIDGLTTMIGVLIVVVFGCAVFLGGCIDSLNTIEVYGDFYPNFWDVHTVWFLLGLAFFPRLTVIFFSSTEKEIVRQQTNVFT